MEQQTKTKLVNNLLELLTYRNKVDIKDYNIIGLIQDMLYDPFCEGDQLIPKGINTEILKQYISDCSNSEKSILFKGMTYPNSRKRDEYIANYIVDLQMMLDEMDEQNVETI